MPRFDEDLKLAVEIAGVAARLALERFEDGTTTTTVKPDGTPVTEADRAVEILLRDRLGAERPTDSVLGEEFGQRGSSARRWILDPIDGTAWFIKHDPDWRVHVALEVDGVVVVAVVVAPARGRQWWASTGTGTYEAVWPASDAGPACRVTTSMTETLESSHIEVWPLEPILGPLDTIPATLATSVTPLQVVRGQIDAYIVDCCSAWDHAPWILLVEEAGGRFTDWAGGHSSFRRGGVFSNEPLHADLVRALGLADVAP
jgi:fructose-1,6-bisphosphatase/inositol monophosphatase family enzyme